MLNDMCMVCRYPNKMKSKESEVDFLRAQLQNLLAKYELPREFDIQIKSTGAYITPPHCMCGVCYSIQDNMFRQRVNQIVELVGRAIELIQGDSIEDEERGQLINNIYNLLNGDFYIVKRYMEDKLNNF